MGFKRDERGEVEQGLNLVFCALGEEDVLTLQRSGSRLKWLRDEVAERVHQSLSPPLIPWKP